MIVRRNTRCLVTTGKHVNNARAMARQLLSKRVPTVTDTHSTTVEVLLDYNKGGFLCGSCRNVTSRVSRVPELELSAVQLSEVT
jgi:hypothetical protein